MVKQHKFQTVDVFTNHVFGGNPLSIFTDARGISDADMQKIAAEMNYSETTFVLPPKDPGNAAKVRIFTPQNEMPFARHPNVGTGYLLASQPNLIPGSTDGDLLIFEEMAGLVKILPNRSGADVIETISITAPQPITKGQTMPAELVAAAVNLDLRAIESSRIEPIVAGTGVPFAIAEVKSREALTACVVDHGQFAKMDENYGYEGDFFHYSFSLKLMMASCTPGCLPHLAAYLKTRRLAVPRPRLGHCWQNLTQSAMGNLTSPSIRVMTWDVPADCM